MKGQVFIIIAVAVLLVVALGLLLTQYTQSYGFRGMFYYPAFLSHSQVHFLHGASTTTITIDKTLEELNVTQSGSMNGTLGFGNTLLVETLPQNELVQIGDIVVYWDNPANLSHQIVHQVVAYSPPCYTLKGINVNDADPGCIHREQIVKRVVLIIPTNDTR